MDKTEFLAKLRKALECEQEISFETILDDLEEWDSLGMMTTAVFLEKDYNFKTTVNDLLEFSTVQELFDKISQ